MALSAALTDEDGSVLLQLSDLYYDRASDGTYQSNSTAAFWSIGCADDRGTTDIAQMRADAAAIEQVAPTVGAWFGYGGTICAQWPVPEAGGLDDYSAQGAAPIVVIGTTNDPATPYAWAESLADTLSSGTLLTYEGEGHTAYGRSNSCILDAVDAYLVDGTVPAEGTRC
jgi:pimeloyl-ACP methyl ester carboxylesterase